MNVGPGDTVFDSTFALDRITNSMRRCEDIMNLAQTNHSSREYVRKNIRRLYSNLRKNNSRLPEINWKNEGTKEATITSNYQQFVNTCLKPEQWRKVEVESRRARFAWHDAERQARYEDEHNPIMRKYKSAEGKMVEVKDPRSLSIYLERYNVEELSKKAKELGEKYKRLTYRDMRKYP